MKSDSGEKSVVRGSDGSTESRSEGGSGQGQMQADRREFIPGDRSDNECGRVLIGHEEQSGREGILGWG